MHIFVSYRRDDSIVHAKLVRNELAARFGAERVFMDIDDIGYGDDFIDAIDSRLDRADVVLIVIGARWAEMLQQRLRGDDWVRHEVRRALERSAAGGGKPRLLPLLVDGARPPSDALPPDLAGLQRLSMLAFDERALKNSVNALLEAVQGDSFENRADHLADDLRRRRRAQRAGALIGVGAFLAGWLAVFDLLGLDTRVATLTMALAGVGRGAAPPWSGQVVLVGIDEASERALGRRFDAGWRAEHARVVDAAAGAGARSLAFDLFFEDAGPPAADAALARALAAARSRLPVVFGVERMNGSAPLIAARFAPLVDWGIACAGFRLAQARAMPLAVQRSAVDGAVASAVPTSSSVPVVHSSLALAAFSGGGRAEPLDPAAQTLRVQLPREQRSEAAGFYAAETVAMAQPGCAAVAKGDRVALQLFDPQALPKLAAPPQRLRYEDIVAGDAATLAALRGRIVLVGLQLAGQDVLPLGRGAERWGVELIAAQIDALARRAAVRPLGGVAQWLLTSALALVGAGVVLRLRHRPAAWRVGGLLAVAIGFVLAAVAWYRIEQQLIGLPYGLAALGLGAWAAGRPGPRRTA